MILQRLTREVWDVLALVEEHGDELCCPVIDFLDARSAQYGAHVNGIYDLIVRFGESGRDNLTGEQCHRVSLDDEPAVWQFRRGRLRVLWFYAPGGRVIVCSHGFFKDSQETPRREVRRVLSMMDRYFADVAGGDVNILEE